MSPLHPCPGNGVNISVQDRDSLFEACSQAFLSAMERVTTSGWGAVMYTISPDKVIARSIKARLD